MAANGVNPYNARLANIFNANIGSSGVGGFMRNMGRMYPIYAGSLFGPVGTCCGGMYALGSGIWNAELDRYSFSGIVKDRNKVGFFDAFSAGFKEQLYTNPIGSLAAGLGMLGIGAKMFGGLSNALAGIGQNNKNCG